MLTIVEDEAAIRRYQRCFARLLRAASTATIPVTLGHPGANEKVRVAWLEAQGVWFFSRKIAGSRYWNAFGAGRPEPGAGVAITCEINIPLAGIDRRTGAAFARDRAGRPFVVHRGRLGGGRKGIGKSLFEHRYRGAWELMEDGSGDTPVALIGALHSPRFARQIALFVRKIARIKEAAGARSAQAELTLEEVAVREELIGELYREEAQEPGAACDQGLIVRDLADALTARGLRTGNDGDRDLMVLNRAGRLRAVVRILTETALSAIHAGAMQLLKESPGPAGDPLRCLVLPGEPEAGLRASLERLGIAVLTYEWQGERANFPGLDPLIPRLTP